VAQRRFWNSAVTPRNWRGLGSLQELTAVVSIATAVMRRGVIVERLDAEALIAGRRSMPTPANSLPPRQCVKVAPKGARALPLPYAGHYGSLTPGARGGMITEDIELKFALEAE
jgi:hypothetical protein